MIYDFIKGSDVAKSTLLHIITGLSFSWLGELIINGSGKEDVKTSERRFKVFNRYSALELIFYYN